MDVLDPEANAELMKRARIIAQTRAPLAQIPYQMPVVMIASGKDSRKSSSTANRAVALTLVGHRGNDEVTFEVAAQHKNFVTFSSLARRQNGSGRSGNQNFVHNAGYLAFAQTEERPQNF